jgi:hypothetical protein
MSRVIYILLAFSFTLTAFAIDHECTALVRNTRHKLELKKVVIKDLLSKESFDGRYIKVVRRNQKKAIKFDDKLNVRACSVYHHMSIARDYFLANFDLKQLKRPRKLIARIEMDLGFEESAHFMHENLGTFSNNALTIPPSTASRIADEPWYYEIWFAPKKKVKVENPIQRAADVAASGPVIRSMLTGVLTTQVSELGSELVQGISIDPGYYASSLLLSVGVTAVVPTLIKWGSSVVKKTIYLDSAMIPEVVYHEFTHFALSEHLSISRHSPVVEGVANFYAAMIGDTDAILKNTGGYSKGLVKVTAKRNQMYQYYMEDTAYAQLDFSFKFLYALKSEFGQEFAEKLVFNAILELKNQPLSIKEGLLRSLQVAMINMDASIRDRYRLIELIQDFGF